MRCLSILIVLAMPMFLWSSAVTVAQEANPAGSYQQTCTDISVEKGNLYAKCQDEKGKARSAKLSNYEKCSTEIVNMNGSLKCASTNTPAQLPDSVLPPGSYLATCKDAWWQGTTLEATCNNGKNQWLPAILRNAHKCHGDIANHQGKLRCTEFKREERRQLLNDYTSRADEISASITFTATLSSLRFAQLPRDCLRPAC